MANIRMRVPDSCGEAVRYPVQSSGVGRVAYHRMLVEGTPDQYQESFLRSHPPDSPPGAPQLQPGQVWKGPVAPLPPPGGEVLPLYGSTWQTRVAEEVCFRSGVSLVQSEHGPVKILEGDKTLAVLEGVELHYDDSPYRSSGTITLTSPELDQVIYPDGSMELRHPLRTLPESSGDDGPSVTGQQDVWFSFDSFGQVRGNKVTTTVSPEPSLCPVGDPHRGVSQEAIACRTQPDGTVAAALDGKSLIVRPFLTQSTLMWGSYDRTSPDPAPGDFAPEAFGD